MPLPPFRIQDEVKVRHLGEQLRGAIGPLVERDRTWSLVDYPTHFNAGDSALFLGTKRLAHEVAGGIAEVTDRRSFRTDRLSGDSVVVIQAGGNWGGLYPTHHQLRLAVLRQLKHRQVIQLPQSVEHASDQSREELRRAVGEHPNFTLLVRDQRSFERASADYDCPVKLVPDIAFGLGPLKRAAPSADVAVQIRRDREGTLQEPGRTSFDWLEAPRSSRAGITLRCAEIINKTQKRSILAARPAARAFTSLATANLARARRLLSQGELVITDRLHGHILCLLLGIPHVVVNDKFGKIESLRRSWTGEMAGASFASSWEGADDALADLRVRLSL